MSKHAKKEKNKRTTFIGGQALMEGVMMRGASSMAMAVRAPDGTIQLETKRLKNGKKWYKHVPIIRGLVAFLSSMYTGVSTLMRSAEVSSPEEETPGRFAITIAVVVGVLIAIGLFILLPSVLSWLIDKWIGLKSVLLSSLIEGGVRLLIFFLYLFGVSRIKDIRRTFMYHGAEHRTINCFEKGYDMTVENVQKCSTRHNRCGTTFLFFVMVVSILVFAVCNWFFGLFGAALSNIFVKVAVRLMLLPLVAGLSYELLRLLAVLPDNWFVNIFRAPGLALQRLTTYPPEDDMAEVALKSFMAVYNMDQNPKIGEVSFGERYMSDVRSDIRAALKGTDADEAETDWILCDALGVKRSELNRYYRVTADVYQKILSILQRRKAGEPLAYIAGWTEFYGYRVRVNDSVLIPRMETETLCEQVIGAIGEGWPHVLDLCTGSGCVALAIAKQTHAVVTAADISEAALATAALNLKGLNVETVVSDMFSGLEGRTFDIIVSNPPYIASPVLRSLSREVLVQPKEALDGGEDGLTFYRVIAEQAPRYLEEGGRLFLEIGYDQAEAVTALLSRFFKDIEVVKDLDGNDRVVKAVKK